MPDPRALAVSLLVGLGIAAFTILWWHWPLAIGGGVAIFVGGLTLIGTASVGGDREADDAAWRVAAPDLQELGDARPAPGVQELGEARPAPGVQELGEARPAPGVQPGSERRP